MIQQQNENDYYMETSNNTKHVNVRPKRIRSDSENSNTSEKTSRSTIKRHFAIETENDQVVFAESKDVNLGKINPITVARTLSDLVGSVENVKN